MTPSTIIDALVLPQSLVQLTAPDVDRAHRARRRLQQAVGEASGRGAHVEAALAGGSTPNAASAAASFSPPRDTNGRPEIHVERASAPTFEPALVTTWSLTRTRPASTSACARRAALDEAAFGEQDVEADHGRIVAGFSRARRRSPLRSYDEIPRSLQSDTQIVTY